MTGVAVADEGHGECGSGGGGHVNWMPFLTRWLKSGRELKYAGLDEADEVLACSTGTTVSSSVDVVPDIPVSRQCSKRAFLAIDRIAGEVVNDLI